MRKYRWSLLKALEYLNFRVPELEIRETFIRQLTIFENRLTSKGCEPKTSNWTEIFDNQTINFENEELLLRNTYLNAQMRMIEEFSAKPPSGKSSKVRWSDQDKDPKPLAVVIKSRQSETQVSEKKCKVILLTDTIDTIKTELKKDIIPSLENTEKIESTKLKEYALDQIKNEFQENYLKKSSVELLPSQTNNNPMLNMEITCINPIKEENKNPITENNGNKKMQNEELKENNVIVDNKDKMTQIINQNNVNNFIINNPHQMEVIDFSTSEKQIANKIHIQNDLQLKKQSAIRKIIDAKKAMSQFRSISIIAPKKFIEPPLIKGHEKQVINNSINSRKQIRGNSAKKQKKRVKNNSVKQKLASNTQHFRGKSLDQLNYASKTLKKRKNYKKQQKMFFKTMNLESILNNINDTNENNNNISSNQAIRNNKTQIITLANFNHKK